MKKAELQEIIREILSERKKKQQKGKKRARKVAKRKKKKKPEKNVIDVYALLIVNLKNHPLTNQVL
jgi:hypothetical protein